MNDKFRVEKSNCRVTLKNGQNSMPEETDEAVCGFSTGP